MGVDPCRFYQPRSAWASAEHSPIGKSLAPWTVKALENAPYAPRKGAIHKVQMLVAA